jgi:integrase
VLTEELWQHRRRTSYPGDDERVFCSPTKGTPFDVARYARTFRLALARAGVERYMRPFHDGRHTSLTNSAAAGMPEMALMTRAGHSDFKTTQRYIDLAGQTFPAETDLAEQRILGGSSRKFRSKVTIRCPRRQRHGDAADLRTVRCAGVSVGTERRRSRTDRAVGYTTALVLKTSWATGPVPLRSEG